MYKSKEKQKEVARKNYLKNRELFLNRSKERRKKYPITPEKAKNYKLIALYGLTLEEYNKILTKQNGLCAVCGRSVKLVVDHCHKSGKVRGLLCFRCNVSLGMADDNPKILLSAVKYLRKHI